MGRHQVVMLHLLREKCTDMNAPGGCSRSVLKVASEGHDMIVRLLIEKDAVVNVRQGDYGSVL
jgi:hypothetical protein